MIDPYALFPPSAHEAMVFDYFSSISESIESTIDLNKAGKSLFLCFSNRCGSTLIASVLEGVGLFPKPNKFLNYEFFNGHDIISLADELHFANFNEYVNHLIANQMSLSGFFASKVSIDQLVWLTKSHKIRDCFGASTFIYSSRRDKIAQAVSLAIAHQSGQWTSFHSFANMELLYDEDLISRCLLNILECDLYFKLFFNLHSLKVVSIVYEDIVDNPSKVLDILASDAGIVSDIYSPSDFNIQKQSSTINIEWEQRFRSIYKGNLCLD